MTNPIPFKKFTYNFRYWHGRMPVTVEYIVFATPQEPANTITASRPIEVFVDCFLFVKDGGPLGSYHTVLAKTSYDNDQILSTSIWNMLTSGNHYKDVTDLLYQYYENK